MKSISVLKPKVNASSLKDKSKSRGNIINIEIFMISIITGIYLVRLRLISIDKKNNKYLYEMISRLT